ncbi:MAG: hypothetical protein U1C73_06365, partial [Dietzia sp.]|nr:hypothetical protein [Dietzia sp.]
MGDHRSARDGSWDSVPFARTAGCGRMMCSADGAEIRRRDGRHYVAGVATCGSVWLCPVCEAKIRTRRAVEMRELGAAHVAAGGSLGLLTLTVRHGPQNGLDELLTAEMEAWKSIQQDDRWRELQRTRVEGPRGGVRWIEAGDELLVGHARTTEATQGFTKDPAGGSWHPHQHLVLFWRDGEDHSADVAWIQNAWAERVEARLGLRPGAVGFDYRSIDATNVDYISKIADE